MVFDKFFEFFPEAKKKYFWDSGLWNSSYCIGSPKNFESTIIYIKRQKYGEKGIGKNQTMLSNFAS